MAVALARREAVARCNDIPRDEKREQLDRCDEQDCIAQRDRGREIISEKEEGERAAEASDVKARLVVENVAELAAPFDPLHDIDHPELDREISQIEQRLCEQQEKHEYDDAGGIEQDGVRKRRKQEQQQPASENPDSIVGAGKASEDIHRNCRKERANRLREAKRS